MAKMSLNKIVGFAGAGLLGFYLFRSVARKAKAVTSINWNINKIDFNKANNSFVVFVRLINPALANVNFTSFVADVYWNGTSIGTLDYRQQITLKPNESREIQIPLRANLTWYQAVLETVLKGKNALSGTFEIKGTLAGEGFTTPVDYKQTVKLL